MIIFDEATSELDSESEERIEELIKGKFKDKTCLIISHKQMNPDIFDRIFRIEDGVLKELKK